MAENLDNNDELFFADEGEEQEEQLVDKRWKVLIVDDEEEIHSVTRLVLDKLSFLGRGILMISAHSGQQAKEILKEQDDVGLILLDVVMETDHAGLEVVKYIRNELKNQTVRIVLRTGQPGQAPEREVIEQYDINDYKNKTELTSEKLFTLTYAGLRSYNDIMCIIRSQRGLAQVIEISKSLFKARSPEHFAESVLREVAGIVTNENEASRVPAVFALVNTDESFLPIAVMGDCIKSGETGIAKEITEQMQKAKQAKKNLYEREHLLMYLLTTSGFEHVVYFNLPKKVEMDALMINILELLSSNIVIAIENVYLNREIEETAREMVYRLGEAVETRSKETGNHVKRVALISELLARKNGLPDHLVELIKLASPMHDLGKISIPDAILNKPGKLEGEEWEIMKSHATIGYEILKGSKRAVLNCAATIAHEHHEKWNGKGYPRGLKESEIDIAGRITAVADVFDALASNRCYKVAWPLDKVLAFFKEERGQSFDPQLVDILFEYLDEFVAIRDKYKDEPGVFH